MSCLEMTAVGPETQTPDPTKHVLYNLGMVLGVDDFTQEFAYHSEHDQWLARDALGYGTLNGLRVSWGSDAKGPFIKVCPGTALTPRGQLVRVKPAQCAYLNPWLASNAQTLLDLGLTPPAAELELWVVLCYRDCPTDTIQIPGEPCQKETETRVPSRLQDDFRLEVRTSPPDQREEDAVRRFVQWLRQIHPTSDPTGTLTLEQFANLVRQEGPLLLSPVGPGSGSPTGSPADGVAIPADEVCEYLQTAFRIWVTELRPKYHREPPSGGTGCEPAPSSTDKFEDCLLLARVEVPIEAAGSRWEVAPGKDLEIDESRRPVLISMRMLQEWLLCGACCGGDADISLLGDVTGPVEDTFVEKLQGVDLQASGGTDGQVLGMLGGIWQPISLHAPTLGGDLVGDPDLENNRLANLQGKPVKADSPTPGDVLTFVKDPRSLAPGEWQPVAIKPPDPVLLRDDVVSQANGSSRIEKLQGSVVSATGPSDRDILTFQGTGATGRWVAAPLPLQGDVESQTDGTNVIVRLQGNDVKASKPTEGSVLTFLGNAWVPYPGHLIAGGAFFLPAPDVLGPLPNAVNQSFGKFEIQGFRRESSQIYLLVTFDTFQRDRPYVVSGMHWGFARQAPAVLELINSVTTQDTLPAILKQMIGLDGRAKPASVGQGLVLRLSYLGDFDRSTFGFTAQITEWS